MSHSGPKKRASLKKQNSEILIHQNTSLSRYIETVKQKQEEDEDYKKWDLAQPLPKLPLPDLHSTLKKYLLTLKPITSREAYENTERIVAEFSEPGGDGHKLQEIIQKVAEEQDNWAYDFWMEDFYMKNKMALPINSNPGFVFPREEFADQDAQLKFAASLISGIIDYKLVIDAETLPVDRLSCREKGQPLCMEQYSRLFSCYRYPGIDKDRQVVATCSLTAVEPEHIIVISLNQIFVLDIVNNFTRLNEDQLYHQLRRIRLQSIAEENCHADVGFLTSMRRDEWGKARLELMKEPTNRHGLDLIERCIFVVCLDKRVASATDPDPNQDAESKTMTSHALQMVHGMGSAHNSGNRWFDKTMQFIVSEDGVCGINYEHSAAEGIVVIELSEHLFRYIGEKRRAKLHRASSICELCVPEKLRWKLSEEARSWIDYAKADFDRRIGELHMCIYKYTRFGREFPKRIQMSPDSFIQLSLQLVYYKLNKRLCSTYESASTRRFRKGRVDNIRANSCEALEWVQSMNPDSNCTNEEKIRLFKKAVQYQTDLMIETILGNGMDCHINTLKTVAIQIGMENIPFIQDESLKTNELFQLSTSQIPTSVEGSFMCYGPVVPDGYGCSYNPKRDYILFTIASNRTCPHTCTIRFKEALEAALNEIYELFNQA